MEVKGEYDFGVDGCEDVDGPDILLVVLEELGVDEEFSVDGVDEEGLVASGHEHVAERVELEDVDRVVAEVEVDVVEEVALLEGVDEEEAGDVDADDDLHGVADGQQDDLEGENI